jgi:lauroyl/myristoyl acyltransferase
MSAAKELFLRANRALEPIIPLTLLWLLMWPLAAYLGARHLRLVSDRVPARSLPLAETSPRPSTWRRWLYLARIHADFFVLAWIDRLSARRWQSRFKAEGVADVLLQMLATRPLVIVSIHTTSLVVLAGWVSSLGIPTGAMPADQSWFSSPARRRKVELAATAGNHTFRQGSGREIVEYLKPGHAVVFAPDVSTTKKVLAPCGELTLSLATSPFRIARATGAVVVPVMMLGDGRWRYQAEVFPPVPQELIDRGDHEEAASYVAQCLVPEVVKRPEQAMDVLVSAILDTTHAGQSVNATE